MSTQTPKTGNGTSFWKTLAIIIGVLVLLSIGWSLIKAATWLILFALVVIGAIVVGRALFSKSD